tara:strand:+ start:538 stop:1350 length:813 start_codon:yes stop_codon:yes gene_type:complete
MILNKLNKQEQKNFVIKLPSYIRTLSFDAGGHKKDSKGQWHVSEVTIIDTNTKKFVRKIVTPSTSPEFPDPPNCLSWQRVHQELKAISKNTVFIGFNSDSDLSVFPLLLKYSLGVHCVQQRYYRVLGQPNLTFKDKDFSGLKDAMLQIGRNDLVNKPNTPLVDAIMTAELWEYCELLNFPQDIKINKGILENFLQIDDRQLSFELDEIDIATNQQKLNEKYKREQFKNCQIDLGFNGIDPITLSYRNRYDSDLDKVVNTFYNSQIQKIVF